MVFQYGERELGYLRRRDPRLGAVIDKIGFIERETHSDIFAELIMSIAGQQISGAALRTVKARMEALIGEMTPQNVVGVGIEGLCSCGMSRKKAENITAIAKKALSGEFEPDELRKLSDEEVIDKLTAFRGIGPWTAQMVLIFCLERPDIFSFGDFGIRRGIELLYNEEKPGRAVMRKYYERYSPYATVASFYLWKIGNGEISTEDL